ncbi:unnamed protein product [Pleuronectes platessa]|uniref:Uncharacterized protein n=1 Tax=Pleuronectes platessa TaxID=8262 RepID=A0A9N7U9L0_PLEPL|nr:unnamed protein product [Pleuronectes platessa]
MLRTSEHCSLLEMEPETVGLTEAGRIFGHALQAVAVERLIAADIVEEVDRSEMIPHEVYGAHVGSWTDSVFSGVRPGAVYQ